MKTNLFVVVCAVLVLSGCAGRSNFSHHNENFAGNPNPKLAVEKGDLKILTQMPVELHEDVLLQLTPVGGGFLPMVILTKLGKIVTGTYFFQEFSKKTLLASGQAEVYNTPEAEIDKLVFLDKTGQRAFWHDGEEILEKSEVTTDKETKVVMTRPFKAKEFSSNENYQKEFLAKYGKSYEDLKTYFGNDVQSGVKVTAEIHFPSPEGDAYFAQLQKLIDDGKLTVCTLPDGRSFVTRSREDFVNVMAKFDGETTASRIAAGSKIGTTSLALLFGPLWPVTVSNLVGQTIAASQQSAPGIDPETVKWIMRERFKVRKENNNQSASLYTVPRGGDR